MAEEITTEPATGEDEPIIETTTVDADAPVEGEEALGDPGKRALDTMKQKLREAEKSAREARAEADRIRHEAEMRDKPAEEQALEAARVEARAEALQAANGRILRSELRAAATGKLADPSDAALFVDLSQFDVSDDGSVDSDALAAAIDALLVSKPHLAVVKPTRFEGAADQGVQRESLPTQVTAAQLQSMTPEQVNQARREGRLTNLMGVK